MSNQILEIRLSPKGIKPVRNGHPWVFRNALAGRPVPASVPEDVVRTVTGNGLRWETTGPAIVCDPTGTPIGWGIYNEASRLALRMITRNSSSAIHRGTFTSLIRDSISRRDDPRRDPDTDVFRLLFGEADGFPGLAVDRLGDALVMEISGAFAWENRGWIVQDFLRLTGAQRILIEPDREMLDRDGVPGPLSSEEHRGEGEAAAEPAAGKALIVRENGLSWYAEPGGGQKTGFYCDQQVNRRRLGELSRGLSVLDGFCYQGGFGLTALSRGAARVTCADSSADALAIVERNRALQGADADRLEIVRGDLFSMLRNNAVGAGSLERYDLVILDPPKLVPARHHRDAGLRAYKDLNMAAMRKMRQGARLATFSCSGAVSRDDFRTALAWAAADAGRVVRIEELFSQGPDHPVPLHFPEAEYLKGFLLRIH